MAPILMSVAQQVAERDANVDIKKYRSFKRGKWQFYFLLVFTRGPFIKCETNSYNIAILRWNTFNMPGCLISANDKQQLLVPSLSLLILNFSWWYLKIVTIFCWNTNCITSQVNEFFYCLLYLGTQSNRTIFFVAYPGKRIFEISLSTVCKTWLNGWENSANNF